MINSKIILTIRTFASWFAVFTFVAIGVGCAGLPERNPLPLELTNQAGVPGIPEARFWGDEWPKYSLEALETYTDDDYLRRFPGIYNKPHNYLAISGGGVKRSILPIGIRTIDSLIRTQGIGDLYQIYSLCVRDGNDFNLAYIPADFTEEPAESFDPVYMGKLFDLGYQMARTGYPWEKFPPGFRVKMPGND